jgi:hypothetical protein
VLARFLSGQQDPETFRHADHVRVAFELLQRRPFLRAAQIYVRQIQRLVERAGNPLAYHETITVAFLSAINERMSANPSASFESFARDNPDLMEKGALSRWYSKEQLASPLARRTFVLPSRGDAASPA